MAMIDYDKRINNGVEALKKALTPQTAFINEVMAAFAQPKRGILKYRSSKEGKFIERKTVRELTQSTKFFVSNNLLAHATSASWVKPKKLFQAMQMAIPPSNNMWVEWDENVRKNYLKKIQDKLMPSTATEQLDDLTPLVGYHIQKLSDNPDLDVTKGMNSFDRFVFQGYTKDKDTQKIVPLMTDFVLFPDPINIINLRRKEDRNDLIDANKKLIGLPYINYFQEEKGEDVNFLLNRSVIGLSSASTMQFDRDEIANFWNTNGGHKLKAVTDAMLLQIAGDMRFLISLLAILNYPLITTDVVQSPQQIDSIRWGRKMPKNEYKLIDINLPKPRGVKIYNQMFTGHGTPKRQHTRRGHFRRNKGIDGIIREKWIEDQVVGNPELGIIIKDYNLRAKS